MPKPALPPTEITRPFWDAAREHRLAIQRCDDCSSWVHWPQVRCPRCGCEHLTPTDVSGRGTIYSFTIVHHVFMPQFEPDIPYILALVELDEQPGLRLLANIVDCPHDALRIGMPVELSFEDRGTITLPQFRPIDRAEARS